MELLVLTTKIVDNDKISDMCGEKISEDIETVNEIINYNHTNYQNKITINGLALTFKTNRTTLNKVGGYVKKCIVLME